MTERPVTTSPLILFICLHNCNTILRQLCTHSLGTFMGWSLCCRCPCTHYSIIWLCRQWVCHGKLWDTMDGATWYTVVNHGNPWYIMVQQYTITHRSRTVVHHGLPWCTIVYYCVPWTNRRRHDDKGSNLWSLKTNPLPSW